MRKPLYLFVAVTAVILFVLGLALSQVLSKKAAKPTVIVQPQAQAPAVEKKAVLEETPSPPSVAGVQEVREPVNAMTEASASMAEGAQPSAPQTQGAAVESTQPSAAQFQKGMIFVAWTENGYSNPNAAASMQQMASLGVDWVGLVTTWYQDKYNSTGVLRQKDKTPTDESLIFAIRKLHELKLKIMLKPHLDLIEAEGKWRGDIEMDNPDDWQAWFDSYTNFILHYANIAAQENVELFCIGTELTRATLTQPERWRDLIKKIRGVYRGQLTYAANWNEEFEKIEFWNTLDYAALDPYFPLVCTLRPKTGELKSAWGDWIKRIEPWQQKINKPVIFAEIGYKSARDATEEPWQHAATGEVDLELQSFCYAALLESFWDKPWFYGAYWWYWGVNPKIGGPLNRGFSPQNKPAQDVIKEWYTKPR